ncbi:MAG TPA: GNAT family N-acetyltransferase [Acidimicrobiales bacterium]|nr:GNAT family N-acetyltransferase [Acidimicrobiales bacterium]
MLYPLSYEGRHPAYLCADDVPEAAAVEEHDVIKSRRLTIAPMRDADLASVRRVCNAAFGAAGGNQVDEVDPPDVFSARLFEYRFAADPDGCFVARDADERIVAALISVARGTLGWFGPLATLPSAQKTGAGVALVEACHASWDRRGVRMRGLETYPLSDFHVGFYGRLGYRPGWTGVGFERSISVTDLPDGVEVGGALPDLSWLYPGLDVRAEAAATLAVGAGTVVTTDDGVALVHVEPTFQRPDTVMVPFAAAATRAGFDRLIAAAEHLGAAAGRSSAFVRAPGGATGTYDVLTGRGYRAGHVFVRMKMGELPDYDRGDVCYADNWL